MFRDINELGRSMVEMLAVLIVIGILSVVGLLGYKKAMLSNDVNATLDSIQKFWFVVDEYLMSHPDQRDKTFYVNSGTTDPSKAPVYLNRKDLLPPFAKGSASNFNLYIKIPKTGTPTITVTGIKRPGLCTALMPGGTSSKSNTNYIAPNRVRQTINDVLWTCQVTVSDNAPTCDL